jgi:hypothetical protein
MINKKLLTIISLVCILLLVAACGDDGATGATPNSSNQPSSPTGSSSGSKNLEVTDTPSVTFQFSTRQDLLGTDAAVKSDYYDIDITWDGLNFSGTSVMNREVQHHSGRYDVEDTVTVSGKVSEDYKTVESIKINNERIGDIYLLFEMEIKDVSIDPDNEYPEDFAKYYYRASGEEILNNVISWSENTTTDERNIRVLEDIVEPMITYDQDLEVILYFYLE